MKMRSFLLKTIIICSLITATMNSCQKLVDNSAADIAVLKASVSALQKTTDSLSKALSATNTNISNLTSKVDSIMAQIVIIQFQITTLNSQLTIANANITLINSQIVILNQQYNSLLAQLNAILAQLSANPSTLNSGLVAYYPFTGNANDSSGNGNNALVYGASLATDRFNASNASYSFSAVNKSSIRVQLLDSSLKNTFTYSVWVYPNLVCTLPVASQSSTAASALINNPCVIHPVWGGTFSSSWSQVAGSGLYVGTNGLYIEEHSDGWEAVPISYSANLTGWHNITVVYDNKIPSLYVDGNFIQKGIQSNRNVFGSLAPDIYNVYTKSGFGAGYNPGLGTTQYFEGKIDEIRFYKRVLTQQEITYLATH